MKQVIPQEIIENRIFMIHRHRGMLSTHFAKLYGVEVRALVTRKEYKNLKSQIVISSWGGARCSRPYAFTEQGVAMLSSVLRSKRAIQVNIAIMRAFFQRVSIAHLLPEEKKILGGM